MMRLPQGRAALGFFHPSLWALSVWQLQAQLSPRPIVPVTNPVHSSSLFMALSGLGSWLLGIIKNNKKKSEYSKCRWLIRQRFPQWDLIFESSLGKRKKAFVMGQVFHSFTNASTKGEGSSPQMDLIAPSTPLGLLPSQFLREFSLLGLYGEEKNSRCGDPGVRSSTGGWGRWRIFCGVSDPTDSREWDLCCICHPFIICYLFIICHPALLEFGDYLSSTFPLVGFFSLLTPEGFCALWILKFSDKELGFFEAHWIQAGGCGADGIFI